MTGNSYVGYRDQEVLIGAITTYASTKIDKSLNVLKGMIRMSIQIVCDSKKLSLKDVKRLTEKERDDFFLQIMSVFFEKMNIDLSTRRKLKFDALQIYERWKESKRLDISVLEPIDSISISSSNSGIASLAKDRPVDEGDLLNELDQLDLDGLDI